MNKTLFPLILILAAGVLLLAHQTTYQPLLAQGDHGRDLHAFSVVLDGQIPYRDFWWVYGPLMPYYYGLLMKIFGVSIPTVLWGQLLLKIAAGGFFFSTLTLFIPPLIAFVGALWFLIFMPDFFYTYNHTGGITALMALTFCLLSFIRREKVQYLYGGLLACGVLLLIKVNFGLTALFVLAALPLVLNKSQGINPRQHIPLYPGAGLVLAVTGTIYAALVQGLPDYYLRQCFPYLKGDEPFHQTSLLQTLNIWWQLVISNALADWVNGLLALFINACLGATLWWITRPPMDRERRNVLTSLLVLATLYFLAMQEFWVSAVFYRAYWAQPFSFLMMFLVMGHALRNQRPLVHALLAVTLFVPLFLRQQEQITIIRQKELPAQYLALPRGRVITGNTPEWFETVEQTARFLDSRLKPNETFLALPYDGIYYYLGGRTSPTRQTIFFQHINITPQQEQDVIADLHRRKVNYILLSSRALRPTQETGIGLLGQNYCPLLNEYIRKNFEEIAQFGDWVNEPGWAWNHGTMILRRKNPPQ